ncbi:hypothetical protein TNCV_2187091 [Trichonephila clavipes]|nr:hypothetical protein TNCV_2187091 [Trichonephila clavipes]
MLCNHCLVSVKKVPDTTFRPSASTRTGIVAHQDCSLQFECFYVADLPPFPKLLLHLLFYQFFYASNLEVKKRSGFVCTTAEATVEIFLDWLPVRVGDAYNPFVLPQQYFVCSVVNEMHVCFFNIFKICHYPVHYNGDRSVDPINNLPGVTLTPFTQCDTDLMTISSSVYISTNDYSLLDKSSQK